MTFVTRPLPADADILAPDGSEVRVLATTGRGSMAQFRLRPGAVSSAVAHRTVDELWYVVAGRGAMWRSHGEDEEVVGLEPGVSLSIPVGTRFQFRSTGEDALVVVGVTMPPWPGPDEAERVRGAWTPTVFG
jgi:mannose-6-phosphate isomerase-like protein (cupin superfamily)